MSKKIGKNDLLTENCLNIAVKDLEKAFKELKNIPPSITIFGSARLKEDNEYYIKTIEIAKEVSKMGYGIITGGGPGIMEAGNKGANFSIGLNIKLPHEQKDNPYIKLPLNFNHFFTRKMTFFEHSKAFIVLPGGFGTLDELFETLVLMQTKKMKRCPIILVGSEFFKPMTEMLKMMLKYECINPEDLNSYIIVDTVEEVMEELKKELTQLK